jgi:hypothetical protein
MDFFGEEQGGFGGMTRGGLRLLSASSRFAGLPLQQPGLSVNGRMIPHFIKLVTIQPIPEQRDSAGPQKDKAELF